MKLRLYTRICLLFFITLVISCGSNQSNTESEIVLEEMTKPEFELFIGTYTRKEGHVDGKAGGIYVYTFDPETGELMYRSTQEGVINPSYLTVHPKGDLIYAVSETGGAGPEMNGEVVAYKFDKESHSLSELNRLSSEGDWPCYISVDNSGQYVMVANYGGSIATYSTDETGQLVEAVSAIAHEGKGPTARQETAHGHMIRQAFDSNTVYAVDLGLDKVLAYTLDDSTGAITATGDDLVMSSGAGPRHMDFHPQLKVTYVLNELNATIEVFSTDEEGKYRRTQIISTLAAASGLNGASADIHVHPNGRFLYASNRGDANSLAIFSVNPTDGSLELVDHQSSLGLAPRSFVIDPSGQFLLVANQDSSDIYVFRIDGSTGLLSDPVRTEVPTPVCLKFL